MKKLFPHAVFELHNKCPIIALFYHLFEVGISFLFCGEAASGVFEHPVVLIIVDI